MILIDIYDMASWWTIVIAFQVILGTTYFLWSKKKSRQVFEPISNGSIPEWTPRPLVEVELDVEEPPLMGKIDDKILNVGATSFLCFDKEESIMNAALKSLEKYGVGSCGPRGFYGTIDVHLELEERLAKFLEVEETCVYAYGFSTIASAIPSYAKRNDIIFADENVCFAIQKGFDAARSEVRYFKHNDAGSLASMLAEAASKKELKPKRRAFLVLEAIYMNTGEMCPLEDMVRLARKYKLRIILDESLTIGVIGKHGRGITEYLNIPRDEIDLIVGSLEHSFATVGGFCAGTRFIVEHQRLSGLGYCFSASLPPMLTQAAISGLDILEERPEVIGELEQVSRKLNEALSKLKHYTFRGASVSPVKHVYVDGDGDGGGLDAGEQQRRLRGVAEYCRARGVAVAVAAYLRDAEAHCPPPSIRLAASTKLCDDTIHRVVAMLDDAYEAVVLATGAAAN